MGLIGAVLLSVGSQTAQASDAGRPPSPYIHVDSDAELAAVPGIIGIGTASNPYQIDGRNLVGTGHTAGVYIGNTTKYLVIGNCSIWGTSSVGLNVVSVMLNNTQNVLVYNNALSADYGGVYLLSSSNCKVWNNTITDGNDNILLISSNNNIIINNTLSGASGTGIRLSSSNNNNLTTNSVSGSYYGIFVDTSTGNTVTKNNCDGVGSTGIYVNSGSANTITYNSCNKTSSFGIFLYKTLENTVSYNFCDDETQVGIYVSQGGSNIVTHNACNGMSAWTGIYVYNSNTNAISANNCSRGNFVCIQLSGSNYNEVSLNDCSNTVTGDGIQLITSSNNVVYANRLVGNTNGIKLSNWANYNTVINNICRGNGNGIYYHSLGDYDQGTSNLIRENNLTGNTNGILLERCTLFTIYNNQLYDNDYGIHLTYGSTYQKISHNLVVKGVHGIIVSESDFNTQDNNTVTWCTNGGIELYGSNHCKIENNTCNNNGYGIYLESAANNMIVRNNCSYSSFGLGAYQSSFDTINYNSFYKNTNNGASLDTCYRCVIAYNNCSLNNDGVYLQASNDTLVSWNHMWKNDECGIYLSHASWCEVSNNTLLSAIAGIGLSYSDNSTIIWNAAGYGEYGLTLQWSENNSICYNAFMMLDYGITFYSSNNNLVFNNYIANNQYYGIELTDSNGNLLCVNLLYLNNGTSLVYVSTQVQAYDNGANLWNTTEYGNYWFDWLSPDANHNGIVDSPYLLKGGASDQLPIAMPTVSIDSPTAAYTNAHPCLFSGTAGGFDITVTWHNAADGSSGTCSGSSAWTASIPLVEGSNTITVTVTDGLGFTSTDTVTIIFTDAGPVILFDPNGQSTHYTNESAYTLNITATSTAPIKACYMAWYVGGVLIGTFDLNSTLAGQTSVIWTHDITLLQGHNMFYFYVNDTAGNQATWLYTKTCDMVKPSLTITSPAAGGYVSGESATIAWTAASSASGIAYYYISVDGWCGGQDQRRPQLLPAHRAEQWLPHRQHPGGQLGRPVEQHLGDVLRGCGGPDRPHHLAQQRHVPGLLLGLR